MSENSNPLINIPELPDSIDNAVKNLTDEPTRGIGKTLADVWYLVFGGISHAADKRRMKYAHALECYHQELSRSVEEIPEEKRIEPSLQITAQALENSKYCIESDELRSMFVKLISNSMNSDYETLVHPSFAEIIKQMSPDDARMLSVLPVNSNIPIVDYVSKHVMTHTYNTKLCNVYLSKLPGFDVFRESAAISSLSRLGLLYLEKESYITNETVYNRYKENDYFKKLSSEVISKEISHTADINKYLGQITPLGKNFVLTCVR